MNTRVEPSKVGSELAISINLDEVKENHYFPTAVFSFKVPGAASLNRHLKETIYEVRSKDQKGIARSNYRELGGWHSKNALHKEPQFIEIAQYVEAFCGCVSDKLGYHPDYALKIGSMWSIINPPGGVNQAHVHPQSLWSGVYYVQAPKNSGSISFTDPRTANVMHQPQFKPQKTRPKSCWTKVHFEPEAGKMLLFPSWLYHSVAPNMSEAKGDDADRIIISFNLSQHRV